MIKIEEESMPLLSRYSIQALLTHNDLQYHIQYYHNTLLPLFTGSLISHICLTVNILTH